MSASGDRSSIRLTHPDPTLALRLTLPFFCAVPDDSPVRHGGIADLPMAGPYYVRSYRAGQQIVLVRNPNYRGRRPARPGAIDVTIGGTSTAAIASVIAGTKDYYAPRLQQAGEMSAAQAAELQARYGRPRARAGPRVFVNPSDGVNYLMLNTSRPLFASARLRRAVNFAIDRRALTTPPGYPARPTDQYLAPGVPGFRDRSLYPLAGPDLARARRLAGPGRHHATLVLCNKAPCPQWAAIIRANLAKIGIDVTPVELPVHSMIGRVQDHANWDIGLWNWGPDFPDPSQVLNTLLRPNDGPRTYNADIARFDDPTYNRRLDAAAQPTGPRRYAAYAGLDADLTAKAAPMVAFSMPLTTALLSARASCVIYQPVYWGIDLAALCLHRH